MARERGRSLPEVRREVLEHLRKAPEGISKPNLVARIRETSPPTVQRALTELRDEYGAPIVYDASTRCWRLTDPSFTLALLAPREDDVMAVLLAAAVLGPMVDAPVRESLERLAADLDDVRRQANGHVPPLGTGRLTAALTLGCPIDLEKLKRVTAALRKGVLRMTYSKPWENRRTQLTIEPWAIRLHDGSAYLRAWCRDRKAPRTYRFAQIQHVDGIRGERPSVAPPESHRVWGDADPAYGIDEDRPDTAVVRVRGGVARWLHPVQWHPDQVDTWLEPEQLLERRVPYRSCREMARRLLMVVDGLVHVEPAPLRDQIDEHIDAYARGRLATSVSGRKPPLGTAAYETLRETTRRQGKHG